VGALLEAHLNIPLGDHHMGDRIDEVTEDVLGLGGGTAVIDLLAEEAIQAAGHQGQLQIAIDFHGDRRGQRVDVEEIHAISDAVLDEHALRVAADELNRGAAQLVGHHDGRFLVAQVGDGDLAD
jgi:hypothetical protein